MASLAGDLSSISGQFAASKKEASAANIVEGELVSAYQTLTEEMKRVLKNNASRPKSEAIGVTIQLGSNAIHGASMDTGLLNTVVGGVVGGSIGALKTKDFAQDYTKKSLNFMNFGDRQNQAQPPADGIIRL